MPNNSFPQPDDTGPPADERGRLLAREQAARLAAEAAERRASFLATASTVLASSLDYETTLASVARLAVPHIADWCAVELLDEDGSPRQLAVAHTDPDKVALADELRQRYPPDKDDPRGLPNVLRTGRPEVYADIPDELLAASARDTEHLRLLRELGLRSAMIVPLVARGRTLGAITLVTAESGRRYGPQDLALAEDLARRAAVAIDNAQLYREVREGDRRKDEFLAMLAHELRNPLAPLLNGLHILRLAGPGGAAGEEACTMMERQIQHLTRLVDDLLDVSRIPRGKLRLCRGRLDLARLVRTAVADRRRTLEECGLEVTVEAPGPAWVYGDGTRLAQVLNNLLDNACKFTDRGGSVRVRLQRDEAGKLAVLSVADTGIGIEPGLLPRLFDVFAQAETSQERGRGGLGLGLALVKGLVELHGGQVRAESAGSRQGAEFTVRLPLLEEPAALSAPASGVQRAVRPLQVLVVEDNRDAADTLRLLLELQGHAVTVAYTGPDGVRAAEQAPPEVVLCDIGLPGLDGYGVAARLRQSPATAAALLIAITGYGTDEDRRCARRAGFDHHLTKPVEAEVLLGLLLRPARPPAD